MSRLPGYKSIKEFAEVWGLNIGTVRGQLHRGSCAWPRYTIKSSKSSHPLYFTWRNIRQRCFNPNWPGYQYWGGRGIKMNLDWKCDFWLFVKEIESLGPKPTPEHSLDRIDNEGHYFIENLRWATKSEQVLNRRKYTIKKRSKND